MKPTETIQQIEKILGKTLHLAPPVREGDALSGVIPFKQDEPKYALEGGQITGLNLTGAGLDDKKWRDILDRSGLDLRHIKVLHLGKNTLTRMPLPFMEQLERLDLSENESLTQADLPEGLSKLKYLELSQCALPRLELPEGLAQLEMLYARQNQLEAVIFKGDCPELSLLDLSDNQLPAFSLPAGARRLQYLYLNNNQIERLDTEGEFKHLDTLHLRGNQLKYLRDDFLAPFPALHSLYLSENPLPDTVRGFIEDNEYKNCLAFIQSYFREMAQGKARDNECKLLLIGDGHVGKSCLVKRLKREPFEPEWKSTHAIALAQIEHGDYLLNLWDFGGQDIYHATHRLFMQANAVYLALWDAGSEKAEHTPPILEHGEWQKYENRHLAYWLDYAHSQGHGSPVIVVQTKRDVHGVMDRPDLRERFRDKISSLEFKQIESKADDWDENGYNDLLSAVRRAVKRIKPNTEIPETWVNLRQAIREKQKKGDKTMTLPEYLELAKDLEDPAGVLENWLTKTGVVFYREGYFHDDIILDQEWAIRAVYAIFDRAGGPYRIFLGQQGAFSGEDLKRWVWPDYSENERELFVGFMLSCEICFETTPEKKEYSHPPLAERRFIAPQLLPPDIPRSVEDTWLDRESLYLRYTHAFLHEGVIQSFIVRTQSLAKTRDIWRHGISLKLENQLALVSAKEKEITVRVTKNGKALLNEIRKMLEKMQESKGVISVSSDGAAFVELETLRGWPHDTIQAGNGLWVETSRLAFFLETDEKHTSRDIGFENITAPLTPRSTAGRLSLEDLRQPIISGKPAEKPGGGKIKILFCAANPGDQRRIQPDVEFRKLKEQLERGKQRDHFEFLPIQLAVTTEELLRAMKDKPNILHFAGHGSDEGILITNANNHSQPLPVEAMKMLFKPLAGTLQIVLLNACYSAAQAEVISKYGMYVIGNNAKIDDPAAISFSVGFYLGMGEGETIEGALRDAAILVMTEHPGNESKIEVWKNGKKLQLSDL